MMNTLANHGILPRDGRGITKESVIKGMRQGLNFDPTLASIMFEQAVIANPEPNATFFTLYVILGPSLTLENLTICYRVIYTPLCWRVCVAGQFANVCIWRQQPP